MHHMCSRSRAVRQWFARIAASACVVIAGLLAPVVTAASEGGPPLDQFPTSKLTDNAALQDGVATFVNYCLNCHSANSMRYNRLRDIGLSEAQIEKNLLFTGAKVGDTMRVAMRPADAKAWFGVSPPDLSVVARARASEAGSGPDWLYTYLRSFYRDSTRPTGWNNLLFPNVGMPHVMWDLQGSHGARIVEERPAEGGGGTRTTVTFSSTGQRTEEKSDLPADQHAHEGVQMTLTEAVGAHMSQAEFDEKVANLVAFLTYMADPTAPTRARMGFWVLLYLSILFAFCWWLNRLYWKDVR